MVEFTPQQMEIIERLFRAGFRHIAIPLYESALCIRRGECAAVLAPVANDGLKLLAPPTYLVGGNLGVRIRRGSHEVFVWKQAELAATAEMLVELDSFRRELAEILASPAKQ